MTRQTRRAHPSAGLLGQDADLDPGVSLVGSLLRQACQRRRCQVLVLQRPEVSPPVEDSRQTVTLAVDEDAHTACAPMDQCGLGLRDGSALQFCGWTRSTLARSERESGDELFL